MARATTTSTDIARFGSLLADETRAEILCALMDGRAHTGSELARHVGVAPSTVSEHLARLLDAAFVAVEPQGRHRYWRLADPELAQILEGLGAVATTPAGATGVPPDLAAARTCYDHLAGELAVTIYGQLVADGLLVPTDGHPSLTADGLALLAGIGVDVEAIAASTRPEARACLDWTQRRHHLAGAAGKGLLDALLANGWIRRGHRPRSVVITEGGRQRIGQAFGLSLA